GTSSFGNRPWSKASPMIGSTRSSVNRATESCTARSSSLSRERTSNRSYGCRAMAVRVPFWDAETAIVEGMARHLAGPSWSFGARPDLQVGGTGLRRRDPGHDLAVHHRESVLERALVQAHGALPALVLVGHVVGHRDLLGAQRDALARLLVGAHGAGGAVRVAVGHVVADHVGGLRGRG